MSECRNWYNGDPILEAYHDHEWCKINHDDVPISKRIGVAKGKLKSPDDLDKYNDEIVAMFGGAL
ncbi:MAG: hypothetical protein J6D53_09235 [Blautia sp.]|nr:hypothetical protein [Blautia sp.]